MTALTLALLLAQQPAAAPRAPADDGAVLIRTGGRVVDADEAGRDVQVWSGTPIDIDVQDAELASVLRLISAVSHLNFVLDDSVKGTVTARMEQVPWDLALAAILQSKGLTAVPFGPQIMVVQPVGP